MAKKKVKGTIVETTTIGKITIETTRTVTAPTKGFHGTCGAARASVLAFHNIVEEKTTKENE